MDKDNNKPKKERGDIKTRFKPENQLWKTRSKHGKDKIFATPEIMWEAACEYFAWCDESPLYSTEWKDGAKRQIPYKRPYTLMGLCIFWGVSTGFLRAFKADETRITPDYLTVIHAIEDIVYTQKFDGAAVGQFNANIISRDLGLADKKDVQGNIFLSDRPVEFD